MKIKINEREFTLKPLLLKDWIELEELGIDINTFGKKDTQVKIKQIRDIIYVALHRADETIDIEFIDCLEFNDITKIFTEGIAPFLAGSGASKEKT